MPITEISAVLNRRNSSGDTTVIYPITKVDNIDGALPITSGGTGASNAATARANLGAAPAFTYGTTDILAGSKSEKADGAMHFVYVTKGGVWDHVKSIFISIEGVWKLVWNIVYSITTKLTRVTGVSSNPATISDDGSVELIFTANDDYKLPDVITVVGATYTWDPKLGRLSLSNPTGNVSVAITGVISDTLDNYIMFLSDSNNFTLEATNVEWDGKIEYSFDKLNWHGWSGETITASDNKVYMRGSGNTRFYTAGGLQLKLSELTSCYGNLNTLLDYINPPTSVLACCYLRMFSGCTNLAHAPELPATSLSESCYQNMFSGCTSLTQPPALPATNLSPYCYYQMFSGCTGIKLSTTKTGDYQTAYRIPTSGTADDTYDTAIHDMFSGTGGTFTGTPSINTTYYGAWRLDDITAE